METTRPRYFVAFGLFNEASQRHTVAAVYECASAAERDYVRDHMRGLARARCALGGWSALTLAYEGAAAMRSGLVEDFGPEFAKVATRCRPAGLLGGSGASRRSVPTAR